MALGHRRLKIIDLSEAGAQPMIDPELGLAIAWNGCIYNYPLLRAELSSHGYRFFSHSDTEVLLEAYHHWGDRFVDHLAGMFAFAIVERDSGRVLLRRDRLGIKPLYLSEDAHLWTLAVDPAAGVPGVGAALTHALPAIFRERGRSYLDLSVAHDNTAAIGLYEKLGFSRVAGLAVKRKNAIDEPLFTTAPETVDDLNPYARIIAEEAIRRGIRVEVLDAETGEIRLSHGGRSVITRESLSEFTSAVAMSRCDDKRLTRRIVSEAGVAVPRGRLATFDSADHDFLAEVGEDGVVVKPTRGEQGNASPSASARARTWMPHWRGPGPSIRRC